MGVADGGSGGDPLRLAQNLTSGFGKIFQIDPLGSGSPNGKYGIPTGNPFMTDGNPATLGEIIKDKNVAQGKPSATRADLRFGTGPNQQIFLLNKRDGTIRVIVP